MVWCESVPGIGAVTRLEAPPVAFMMRTAPPDPEPLTNRVNTISLLSGDQSGRPS